jgi:acetyl-CoA carboxylase carboxyltransferase component
VSPDKPRRAYDPRALIKDIFDRKSFFEIGPAWAQSIVTGLARIGGIPVGVLAHHSQHQGGALTAEAADKQLRFVEMCDTFHIPMVYLIDAPGIMVGQDAERAGTLRRGTRALSAMHRATVPLVSLHIRRSFGFATMAAGNPNQLSIKLAWPTATVGAMGLPIEAAASVLYKDELEKAEDPEVFLAEVIERLRAKVSVWAAAEQFNIEDIIDPRETRKVIYNWLNAAISRQRPGPKSGPQYRP